MKSQLADIRENIISETVALYPDFDFFINTNADGDLTIDHRGTWEPEPEWNTRPYLTITHSGDRYEVTHYAWGDAKKYKTLKGAAKYINAELHNSCDRKRKHKAETDAKREFTEKSLQMLRDLHDAFSRNGITSRLCLTADRFNFDHVNADAPRINSDIDITVSPDYRLELKIRFPHFCATTDTAIDLLSTLTEKGTA